MFFKHTPNNRIENLLNKEDLSLEELLDEDCIIEECRTQNSRLFEFLLQQKVIDELVTLTTVEPSIDLDEKTRFKYPNIASEILACDVPSVNEKLASDPTILEKLYAFLENDAPLNPLLASFFTKILCVLLVKKNEQNWLSYQFTCLQVVEFLKSKDNFVSLLLRHMDTSAIMDLTLKLLSDIDDPEMRKNVTDWLNSQNIVQSLVELLDPDVDNDKHHNVSFLLCNIIEIFRFDFRERITDPIITTLESTETLELLLSKILGPVKNESSIVSGVQVLLTLLDFSSKNDRIEPNTDNDEGHKLEHKQTVVQNLTKAIMPKLRDFYNLLLDPPKKTPIQTTICLLDPPLGNTRLHVAKLVVALLKTESPEIIGELIGLGMFETLLDLFFRYSWNNFLHAQVELCIGAVLASMRKLAEGDNSAQNTAMFSCLFCKCKLLTRILEAWVTNDHIQKDFGGARQGYMGHIISISKSIANNADGTPFGAFLKESIDQETMEKWENFISGPLAQAIQIQDILLAGANPRTANDSENEAEYMADYNEQSFYEYVSDTTNVDSIKDYSLPPQPTVLDGPITTTIEGGQIDYCLNERYDQLLDAFRECYLESIRTEAAMEDEIFDGRAAILAAEEGSNADKDVCQSVIEKQGEDDFENDDEDDDEGDNAWMAKKEFSSKRASKHTKGNNNASSSSGGSNNSDEDDKSPVSPPINNESSPKFECAPQSLWGDFEEDRALSASADEGWANFEANFVANFENDFDANFVANFADEETSAFLDSGERPEKKAEALAEEEAGKEKGGETITVEENKVEKNKVEENKVEENKVEEKKVKEEKVEENIVEENKVEENEVEEIKVAESQEDKLEETAKKAEEQVGQVEEKPAEIENEDTTGERKQTKNSVPPSAQ